ncbi:MAG: DUF4258 domain-containing protein [Chloroflexi bacterium]|nr:DUF4258 domain-containing protein [Chloroflexota bacterium]
MDSIRRKIEEGNYWFTLHAGSRMIERDIAVIEVVQALLSEAAEIIEDYPSDPRGSSCLVLGKTARGRSLHVHCSYPPGIAIITSYQPELADWIDERTRRGEKP